MAGNQYFSVFFFFPGVLSSLKPNAIREAFGLCSRVALDCLL